MVTERLLATEKEYESTINRAAEILKGEGVVAIPTETVYGLAASAYSDKAIKKVFLAKGRPQDNPLIVHISDMNMLSLVARDIPDSAFKCAEKFWPGPLTLILNKTESIAQSVTAGLNSVAVRMPFEKTARDIIEKTGIPLAAPSANISGAPSPTSALHVIADMDEKIDAVVMGNDCTVGVESTVLSLVGETPCILRPGAVTLEQLQEVLGNVSIDKAVLSQPESTAKVASPGMKYKHYAPKTETYLVEGESELYIKFVNSRQNCIAVCFNEEAGNIKIKNIPYGSVGDEASLARKIFSVLRSVDEFRADAVYIHAPSKSGVGLAVYNRLLRASAFRVIKL